MLPQFKDRNDVNAVMKIYNDVKQEQQIGEPGRKRHPLIVIEGLDGTGNNDTQMKNNIKIL